MPFPVLVLLFFKNRFAGGIVLGHTKAMRVWDLRAGLCLLFKRLARYRCLDASFYTCSMTEHVGGHRPLSGGGGGTGRVQNGVIR